MLQKEQRRLRRDMPKSTFLSRAGLTAIQLLVGGLVGDFDHRSSRLRHGFPDAEAAANSPNAASFRQPSEGEAPPKDMTTPIHDTCTAHHTYTREENLMRKPLDSLAFGPRHLGSHQWDELDSIQGLPCMNLQKPAWPSGFHWNAFRSTPSLYTPLFILHSVLATPPP